VKLVGLFLVIFLLSGCAQNSKGERTTIVFGLGFVKTQGTNMTGGSVLKTKSCGILLGAGGLNAGYIEQTSVKIATNSNIVLELK
jgi:hypothetical protein